MILYCLEFIQKWLTKVDLIYHWIFWGLYSMLCLLQYLEQLNITDLIITYFMAIGVNESDYIEWLRKYLWKFRFMNIFNLHEIYICVKMLRMKSRSNYIWNNYQYQYLFFSVWNLWKNNQLKLMQSYYRIWCGLHSTSSSLNYLDQLRITDLIFIGFSSIGI